MHVELLFAWQCRADAAIIESCRTARKLRCYLRTCRGLVTPIGIARKTASADQLVGVLNDRTLVGAVDSQISGLQRTGRPVVNQISQHLRPVGEP